MKTSREGIAEIASHEGIVLGPYLDSVGVWTDGIGHTAAAGGLNPANKEKVDTRSWTQPQVNEAIKKAISQFSVDIVKYEVRVSEAITQPLTKPQFDALVSFDLNTGGIFRANLTKEINSGDFTGKGFMGWLRPKEITGRRTAERDLFKYGRYSGKAIPVYDVTKTGKVIYRYRISKDDFLKLYDTNDNVTPLSNNILYIFLGWAKKLFNKQPF